MSLFNKLRKKYEVRFICTNCGYDQISHVPKGTTKENFIDTDQAVCHECGCDTLELPKKNQSRLDNKNKQEVTNEEKKKERPKTNPFQFNKEAGENIEYWKG